MAAGPGPSGFSLLSSRIADRGGGVGSAPPPVERLAAARGDEGGGNGRASRA